MVNYQTITLFRRHIVKDEEPIAFSPLHDDGEEINSSILSSREMILSIDVHSFPFDFTGLSVALVVGDSSRNAQHCHTTKEENGNDIVGQGTCARTSLIIIFASRSLYRRF